MSSLLEPISRRNVDDVHLHGIRRHHSPVAAHERAALGHYADLADRRASKGKAQSKVSAISSGRPQPSLAETTGARLSRQSMASAGSFQAMHLSCSGA